MLAVWQCSLVGVDPTAIPPDSTKHSPVRVVTGVETAPEFLDDLRMPAR
jgi:hypothetical protein